MAQKGSTRNAKYSEKKPGISHQDRQRRRQQILFGILAAIIIFSWLITLVLN